jgi:hypothetical protein
MKASCDLHHIWSVHSFILCTALQLVYSHWRNTSFFLHRHCFHYLNLSQVASLRVARPPPLLIKRAHPAYLTFSH